MAMAQLHDSTAKRRRATARELAHDPEAMLEAANLDVADRARAMVLARLREMPASMRRAYLRGLAGNRAAAVRSFCRMCVGWQRGEAGQCSDPACPLYPHRPERRSSSATTENPA